MPINQPNFAYEKLTQKERDLVFPRGKGRRPVNDIIEDMVPKRPAGRPKKEPEGRAEWE